MPRAACGPRAQTQGAVGPCGGKPANERASGPVKHNTSLLGLPSGGLGDNEAVHSSTQAATNNIDARMCRCGSDCALKKGKQGGEGTAGAQRSRGPTSTSAMTFSCCIIRRRRTSLNAVLRTCRTRRKRDNHQKSTPRLLVAGRETAWAQTKRKHLLIVGLRFLKPLYGADLAGHSVAGLQHHAVRPFPNFPEALVNLHRVLWVGNAV